MPITDLVLEHEASTTAVAKPDTEARDIVVELDVIALAVRQFESSGRFDS